MTEFILFPSLISSSLNVVYTLVINENSAHANKQKTNDGAK